MRNRIVKYHLIKWTYYDNNLSYLNDAERAKMKSLYLALKELDPEERQFLAEKYRVAKKPYIPDATLAAKRGLSLKEYREKRIFLEDKLRPIIQQHDDLRHEELMKDLKECDLYVKKE